MNRDLLIAFGDQLYATVRLALVLVKSTDQPEEFGAKVIGPLSTALEHVRHITHIGDN